MAGKTFDVSKFRKSITKSIDGISAGFNDPTDWISTGCYALNYLISGSFTKGVPLGKVTMFAGESGCLPKTAMVNARYTNTPMVLGQPNIAFELPVTVGKLRSLYNDTNVTNLQLDTPDGWLPIGEWFDKGVLPLIRVETDNFETICAINHLIQLSDESWILSENLVIGDRIITYSGIEEVIDLEFAGDEECYDFEILHPNHRYWGDGIASHNSGKSYLCSGNIVKNAQEQGIFVVLIDSENALDEDWLQRLGVDTSESKLLKLNMAMIDDVAKTISEFMKEYKDMEDKPKVLFVVDSLGMLLTPTDVDQFADGMMKGDMGRKPKALAALVRNCVNMFGSYNVGMVTTNHTYASQNIYDPDDKISGGAMFVFASSIVVAMKKYKLKEDADGTKTSDVLGIRASCKIVKTRYAKPFEDVEIHIPYTTGMSPYSGLFSLFEKAKLITKDGNRYMYIDANGEIHKYYRKEWNRNENGILDLVMSEYNDTDSKSTNTEDNHDMSDDIDNTGE